MRNKLFPSNLVTALAVAVLVAAAPLTACSAEKPGAVAKAAAVETPEVLDQAVKVGLTVEKSFKAVPGLDGWVVKDRSGQYSVIYTTPDGKHLVSGLLIDGKGQNLTQVFAETHVPKPDYAKHWGALEKSAWVATGEQQNPKSVIYVFLDPNCVFCSLAAKAFVAYEKAGLQVRWIPVGLLAQDSLGKAAAILESANPGETLASHEMAYGKAGADTLKAVKQPKPETAKKLQANAKLMAEMGFTGTPATLYKDAKGNVMAQGGMMRLSDLPSITGLPEQPQPNPDLARFK